MAPPFLENLHRHLQASYRRGRAVEQQQRLIAAQARPLARSIPMSPRSPKPSVSQIAQRTLFWQVREATMFFLVDPSARWRAEQQGALLEKARKERCRRQGLRLQNTSATKI